jgi:U3 small nucleolar RNA-associated protein MPP10
MLSSGSFLPSKMGADLREIEKLLVKPKEWRYLGEVDKTKRPKNSLLSQRDIEFKQGVPLVPLSSKQNNEVERITLQRIREGTFDNYEFKVTREVEVIEEVYETKDLELSEIVALYNEIEEDLMRITDFGCIGFMPDCEIKVVDKETPRPVKKKRMSSSLSKIRNVTVLK